MGRARNATGRLSYFLLGAVAAFLLTVYTMSVRLEGLRLACDNAVYTSLVRGCVEGKRTEEACRTVANKLMKDFEDITSLQEINDAFKGTSR